MEQPAPRKNMNLNVDYRVVIVALLVVIAAMLAIWKPWNGSVNAKDRTITVTGEATLKAAPDEFVFAPSYQFTTSDKDAALKDLSAKSDEVVAGLKKLGVASSAIATNANSWAYPAYDGSNSTPTYTLSVTVTLTDDKLVQKVEDYLLSTTPSGSLTPQANFSDAKEKALQTSARDKATKEARAKAEQSAKNLGFHLGAVKSVNDGSGFGGGIQPLMAKDIASSSSAAEPSITVQPGENTLNYSVTVTYYIR